MTLSLVRGIDFCVGVPVETSYKDGASGERGLRFLTLIQRFGTCRRITSLMHAISLAQYESIHKGLEKRNKSVLARESSNKRKALDGVMNDP